MAERRRRVTEVRREGRRLTGYAMVWGQLSLDLGGFVERFQRGAFADSLRNRRDVVLLHSHDDARPFARTTADTMSVAEDDTGLRIEAELPNSAEARHLAMLINSGVIDGMSVRFAVTRAEDETWSGDKPGGIVRTIKRAVLIEASTVTWPAYPSTTVSVDEPAGAGDNAARDMRLKMKREQMRRRLVQSMKRTLEARERRLRRR